MGPLQAKTLECVCHSPIGTKCDGARKYLKPPKSKPLKWLQSSSHDESADLPFERNLLSMLAPHLHKGNNPRGFNGVRAPPQSALLFVSAIWRQASFNCPKLISNGSLVWEEVDGQ